MAGSAHNLRPHQHASYVALHQGADPGSSELANGEEVYHDSFSELATSSPTRPEQASAEVRLLLVEQLAATKAEKKRLQSKAELRSMQEELAFIQAENQRLKTQVAAPRKSSKEGIVPTIDHYA